ncbi:vacuolar fusion protein CCZ1 homolog B [Physcomitrium patens]|uniref:CCZ1/INTU/HSP4 first Longin domain-containing protein n=1 Tax=Physcomitrium patens TaxID=3218 RepID=A0A2K1J7N0_PHYPA|nr:vacuolar fusion protein CCZ1 homolog B-like [Physcomitrium patens]PNR37529.1 hypothetical protein PHYPA_020638 [Physcomitrium patens]|eukprot:XP_024399642.1 vacuolar fusion protein CCZ1 homolog B-like [Physcomitrella patens]
MGAWAESVQVCVFDMRRGQQEGHELDKILFFYPVDCPLSSQLSVVGLSEGLITFTRIFSPDKPCQLMQAEGHCHVFFNCEPDIWMVMVIEKSKEGEEEVRFTALEEMLKEAHDLFVMFFGSIRDLLQNHPLGDLARSSLHAFFPDYLAEFVVGSKLRLPSISEGLTERGMVEPVNLDRDTLLQAQSLVGLLESWFGGGTVRHTLVLFHNYLVLSTLSAEDTARLYSYASLRLTPAAISLSKRKSQAPSLSAISATGQYTFRNLLNNGTSASSQTPASEEEVSSLLQRDSKKVSRPMKPDGWWKEGDNFLDTDSWGSENKGAIRSEASHPTIWLKRTKEEMRLCVYQLRTVTLIMLVPTCSSVNGLDGFALLRGQLLEKGAQEVQKLEERISKEWKGINASHVPGYRYLCCDRINKTVKASPPSKVATLSKESLAALNVVRADVDLVKGRLEGEKSGHDPDLEICVRTKQNAWLVVRARGGQELYTVQERAGDTLLLASDAVEKLNKRHFNGHFSSD